MPKLKTHKGASKRFRVTGSGKILRRHSFGRHNLGSKSPARKRRLGQAVVMSPADVANVRDMLPYG